ncbi:aldose 1-epimerase [Paenibacillaceae bacterium WGS1546]|uniref:aldose 1-epimerase n=1 Tax=Cohnella sp. WGS1546 TaxID=3366810 RepID=UPI00372D095D
MNRYETKEAKINGFSTVTLIDTIAQAEAEVTPDIGSNLYRFRSAGHSVILPPVDLETLKHEKFAVFQYGTPILFPPNRVKNATFTFRGQVYTLPLNEPPHHHLHGEICSRSWEVVEIGVSQHRGAYLTTRFRYASHPDILYYFQHPMVFTVTYRLYEGRLHMHAAVTNEGEREAPFAFGLHPYFSVPLSDESVRLIMPAAAEWPVTREAFVTGQPEITPFSKALNEGIRLEDYPEGGCSLLSLPEGQTLCRLEVPRRGYAIYYRFDTGFPYALLFRPSWEKAVSIEPYTAVTDAFNLPLDSSLTGAQGIAGGETRSFDNELWVEESNL